jgi:hypothetical protein
MTFTSHVMGSVTSWMAVTRRQQAIRKPIVTWNMNGAFVRGCSLVIEIMLDGL